MNTLALDENMNLTLCNPLARSDSCITFVKISDKDAIAQLIVLRVISPRKVGKEYQPRFAINWYKLTNDFSRLESVMPTMLGNVIGSTEGVVGVDFSKFQFSFKPRVSISNVDCLLSKKYGSELLSFSEI